MKYQDICVKVTNKFLKMTETDKILPWQKPWTGSVLPPINISFKKMYLGWNNFFLSCTFFSTSYRGTFNQIKKMKGKIQKGEKGYPIIFWTDTYQETVTDEKTGMKKKISLRFIAS
jgi:antirestriction protein ArdC